MYNFFIIKYRYFAYNYRFIHKDIPPETTIYSFSIYVPFRSIDRIGQFWVGSQIQPPKTPFVCFLFVLLEVDGDEDESCGDLVG